MEKLTDMEGSHGTWVRVLDLSITAFQGGRVEITKWKINRGSMSPSLSRTAITAACMARIQNPEGLIETRCSSQFVSAG